MSSHFFCSSSFSFLSSFHFLHCELLGTKVTIKSKHTFMLFFRVNSINTIRLQTHFFGLVIAIKESKETWLHQNLKKQFVQQIGCSKCFFIYYINQLHCDRINSIRVQKPCIKRKGGTSIFLLCSNLHISLHQLTLGVFHVK